MLKNNVELSPVRGHSMRPVIPEGSYIAIDKGNTDVISGEVYVLKRLDVEHRQVKVIYVEGGQYRLNSHNADYADELVNVSDVEIVGKVFHVVKPEKVED